LEILFFSVNSQKYATKMKKKNHQTLATTKLKKEKEKEKKTP
jgi:hypothetical protein